MGMNALNAGKVYVLTERESHAAPLVVEQQDVCMAFSESIVDIVAVLACVSYME